MNRPFLILVFVVVALLGRDSRASSGIWPVVSSGIAAFDPTIAYCGQSEVQDFFPGTTTFMAGQSSATVGVCRPKLWSPFSFDESVQIWLTYGPGVSVPVSANLHGPSILPTSVNGTFFVSTVAPSLTFPLPISGYTPRFGAMCFVGFPTTITFPTIPPSMVGQPLTFQPALYHYDGTGNVLMEVGRATQVIVQ
ncbi:MAG: hypothetical protein ACF8XB_09800 [Planctomycetota bacterium JB042]